MEFAEDSGLIPEDAERMPKGKPCTGPADLGRGIGTVHTKCEFEGCGKSATMIGFCDDHLRSEMLRKAVGAPMTTYDKPHCLVPTCKNDRVPQRLFCEDHVRPRVTYEYLELKADMSVADLAAKLNEYPATAKIVIPPGTQFYLTTHNGTLRIPIAVEQGKIKL